MRFTMCLLGTEILALEFVRDDEPDASADDDGAASGGQFELGFRPSKPSWCVMPGEPDG